MAKKKKKSVFSGKVKGDAARKASSGNTKYLKLPDGISMYSPTPGKTEKIDIIPYYITDKKHPDRHEGSETAMVGDLWFKRPFKIHKDVGADNNKYVCPTSFGKKCPICDFAKSLSDDGADWNEIKEFRPKDRVLYAVIPRGVKKVEEEIHIFDFSYHMFHKLLDQEVNENDDFEAFPDVEQGFTLKVRWEEREFGKHKFADAQRIDFEEREEALDPSIVDEVPCLDDLLEVLSYDDLKSKFNETPAETPDTEEEEEEDLDDDENPFEDKPKKGKKKKKEEKKELSWDDLIDMDITEMVDVIEETGIDVDPEDYDGIKALRKAVAEELEIEVPKKKKKSKK